MIRGRRRSASNIKWSNSHVQTKMKKWMNSKDLKKGNTEWKGMNGSRQTVGYARNNFKKKIRKAKKFDYNFTGEKLNKNESKPYSQSKKTKKKPPDIIPGPTLFLETPNKRHLQSTLPYKSQSLLNSFFKNSRCM